MKTDYDTKIKEIEEQIPIYITTSEFNQFSGTIFDDRLKQANLASESDFADYITKACSHGKLKHINKKLTSNKAKHLKAEKTLTNH